MKYPQLYQQFNAWAGIPADQWLALENKLVEKSLAKAEFLLQPGEDSQEFGMIVSGLFRLYYADKNGKEQIKSFRRSGELVGAYAEMLLKIPSRTYI